MDDENFGFFICCRAGRLFPAKLLSKLCGIGQDVSLFAHSIEYLTTTDD